jgi:uncharacterized protein (DUF934 family)
MPLLRDGQAVGEDAWQPIEDGASLPADGKVVVSYDRFLAEREALQGRNSPVGVRVKNTQKVDALADSLDRLDLVILEFPKFNDGRAYSQARILRERVGYEGELRASGQVLRDQLLFMRRCGFDAFEIAKGDAVEAWQAALAEFDRFYQPTGNSKPSLLFRGRDDHAEAAE